ncbi:MAG: twin-arginine translocase TatA/TatE family subunit [Litorimonas sp.]
MAPNYIGIIIIVIIAIFVFGGRGRISSIMGDLGKGITSFKKGMKDGLENKPDATVETDPAEEALDVTPRKKK